MDQLCAVLQPIRHQRLAANGKLLHRRHAPLGLDLNFQNSAKLPPLTPQMKALIRGNWYPHQ